MHLGPTRDPPGEQPGLERLSLVPGAEESGSWHVLTLPELPMASSETEAPVPWLPCCEDQGPHDAKGTKGG